MEKDLINLRNKFLRAGLKKEAEDIQTLIKEAALIFKQNCTPQARHGDKCVDGSKNPKTDGAIYQMQELINSKGEKIKSKKQHLLP